MGTRRELLWLTAWPIETPIAIQEQNSFPGLTTRFFSRYARQVHNGFPEASRHLSPGRPRRSSTRETRSSRLLRRCLTGKLRELSGAFLRREVG